MDHCQKSPALAAAAGKRQRNRLRLHRSDENGEDASALHFGLGQPAAVSDVVSGVVSGVVSTGAGSAFSQVTSDSGWVMAM